MNWQCRLYGHQWRHPGEYEVVVVDEGVSAYPFQCAACGNEMVVDGNGGRHLDVRDSMLGDTGPELDSATERDVVDESRDGPGR